MRPSAIMLFVVAAFACAPVDNGLIVRRGLELHQDEYPVTVSGGEGEQLDEAIAWWNDQAGQAVFIRAEVAEVTVEVGYVPCLDIDDACPWGVADVGYSAEGMITSCDVTLSVDIAYHQPTLRLVRLHELGHCLGLDDDPPSLDLGSIMSDPPREGAGLTEHDRSLL